jgi:hypothetical protein
VHFWYCQEGKVTDKQRLAQQKPERKRRAGVYEAAVKIMGDEVLRQIAQELVDIVRRNVTIDYRTRRISVSLF